MFFAEIGKGSCIGSTRAKISNRNQIKMVSWNARGASKTWLFEQGNPLGTTSEIVLVPIWRYESKFFQTMATIGK